MNVGAGGATLRSARHEVAALHGARPAAARTSDATSLTLAASSRAPLCARERPPVSFRCVPIRTGAALAPQ